MAGTMPEVLKVNAALGEAEGVVVHHQAGGRQDVLKFTSGSAHAP